MFCICNIDVKTEVRSDCKMHAAFLTSRDNARLTIKFFDQVTYLTLHISVHPCDRDHGCKQNCVKDNSAKKFHCTCKQPEFKLAANGKDCEAGRKTFKS